MEKLKNCGGHCELSCYDCLKTYRNMVHHQVLNRHEAVTHLEKFNDSPRLVRSVPPTAQTPTPPSGEASTNVAEMRLSALLRDKGFPHFKAIGIALGR